MWDKTHISKFIDKMETKTNSTFLLLMDKKQSQDVNVYQRPF